MFNFLMDFDRDFYSFNRMTKDMKPYVCRVFKDKTTIIHNVLGIKSEDLKVEIVPDRNSNYLEIHGETKNEIVGSTYNVNSRFSIDKDSIDHVEYNVEDGLLYVDLFYKEPKKVEIPITKK